MSVRYAFPGIILTQEPSAHKAASPDKYALKDQTKKVYPLLQGIEERHSRSTSVHLQVYDGIWLAFLEQHYNKILNSRYPSYIACSVSLLNTCKVLLSGNGVLCQVRDWDASDIGDCKHIINAKI